MDCSRYIALELEQREFDEKLKPIAWLAIAERELATMDWRRCIGIVVERRMTWWLQRLELVSTTSMKELMIERPV